MNMKRTITALAFAAATSAGAVSLPSIFGNNMVLQHGQRIPVWGKGTPGESISVEFSGQSAKTIVGNDGKWHVDLKPLAASALGEQFRVIGDNEIVFTNVVVGEVWFCSGQSNMEFTMSSNRKVKDWEKEVAAANWPLIRHFRVAHKVANKPLDDVSASWVATTPQTIPPQSAVAFFFGETLHKNLNIPIGLINSSWGGTRIEPWTPAAHDDDLWLLQNIRKWDRPQDVPTVLWNGMVAGLVPFAIKGAIWYQGCANRTDGAAYLDKTVSLVRGWRREWGQGDFPYFLVQLAPYKYDSPTGTTLPLLQLAQARVEDAVPNSGYTVINDVGDVQDIHPTDKRTVGMRLAYQVLDRVYGKFVRPWKTPIVHDYRIDGDAVRIVFDNADGLKTRDGLAPTCFEICGLTGKWIPAEATIDGNQVTVRADSISSPLGVRFAGYNGSTPNLVNGNGLPAGPFTVKMPCPLGTAESLPAANGLSCIQRYDIPQNCDIRKAQPHALATIDGVQRVGYLLELENRDGATSFAYAEMDAYSTNSADLILTASRRPEDLRISVTNLTIASNVPRLPSEKTVTDGFLEFYYSNYSPRVQPTPEKGNPKKYDINDTPQSNAVDGLGYGCFQIHDVASQTTILAFNHFNNATTACDVGIGNASGEHPDWTFARNAPNYKTRRFSVWAK